MSIRKPPYRQRMAGMAMHDAGYRQGSPHATPKQKAADWANSSGFFISECLVPTCFRMAMDYHLSLATSKCLVKYSFLNTLMPHSNQAFSEYLFSYGTLQQERVQLSTFGRKLDGQEDEMPRYALTMLKIEDPEVVALSGKTHHPIVTYTGNSSDKVKGMVFSITPEELLHADAYEVSSYRRDRVVLASGIPAWVYVDARSSTPSN